MIDAVKQAMERLEGFIANVTPDQYALPTPCAEFDVKGLLNHLVGGAHMLTAVGTGQPVDASAAGQDFVGDDPLGAYKSAAHKTIDAWSDPAALGKTFTFPFGEMPGAQAMGIMLLESYVHGWDLAKATGQDGTIPAPIAEMLLAGAKASGMGAHRTPEGHPFGPEVEVADDASPSDKLVAFVGRTP